MVVIRKELKINEDNKTIYEAITNLNEKITTIKVDIGEIKTAQTLHHQQNQKDIREYSKTADSLIKVKSQVFYQWFFISAIFLGIMTLFIRSI